MDQPFYVSRRVVAGVGLLAAVSSGALHGCTSREATGEAASAPAATDAEERVIQLRSPAETMAFFDSVGFWGELPDERPLTVPRAYVTRVSPEWRNDIKHLSVEIKKEMFFRALVPLVLHANELILADRTRLMALRAKDVVARRDGPDAVWLRELAVRYGVRDADGSDDALTPEEWESLVRRVDAAPAALALGQGAYESAYGASRFAGAGNALFGQWTWGKGITPQEQRGGKGDYKIAAYDTPLESVKAYMHNLNTHRAYEKFRRRRAELRSRGEPLRGTVLAETLDRYSEKGQEYVRTLKGIMRTNGLEVADDAVLRYEPTIWLNATDDPWSP